MWMWSVPKVKRLIVARRHSTPSWRHSTVFYGKEQSLLQISDIRQSLLDLSGLPQYFTAFAEPLGRPLLQCELKGPLDCTVFQRHCGPFGGRMLWNTECGTVPKLDGGPLRFGIRVFRIFFCYYSLFRCQEHSDVLWRDFSGFVVADRFRYCEVNIKWSVE